MSGAGRRYRMPRELAAVPVGRRIRMPVYFDEELFDQVRRRAERDGVSVSDLICSVMRRRLGG